MFFLHCIALYYVALYKVALCCVGLDALGCIPSCLIKAFHCIALYCIMLSEDCIVLYWFGCIELYSKLSNEGSLLRP